MIPRLEESFEFVGNSVFMIDVVVVFGVFRTGRPRGSCGDQRPELAIFLLMMT